MKLEPITNMVKCEKCGRFFKPRIPKGGDGSGNYPARHKMDGKPCPGIHDEGELMTAERIQASLDRDGRRNTIRKRL